MSSMSSTNCSSMRVNFFVVPMLLMTVILLLRLLHLVAAPLLSMLRCTNVVDDNDFATEVVASCRCTAVVDVAMHLVVVTPFDGTME